MRKLLRNIARAKMKEAGYSKPNKRMRSNWRRLTGAYPISLVTGKPMSPNYCGVKKRKKGSIGGLFCYAIKGVKA